MSFWTSKLTFPLHIDKYSVKLFQYRIVKLSITPCEFETRESKVIQIWLSKAVIQIILLYRPQHSTTHLLIKRADSIKIIHKNPRNWPQTSLCLTISYRKASRLEGMLMWTSPETPARTHYMFQMVQWLGPRQRHWKRHWMHWFWMFQPSQNWKVH